MSLFYSPSPSFSHSAIFLPAQHLRSWLLPCGGGSFHLMFRPWLLLLTLALHLPFLVAQLDTLIGLQGEDFVLLAADPVLSRSLTLLHSHHDKLPLLGSHHCLALGGPVYFTEIISEVLGAEKRLFEKRLRRPLSTRAVAAMARNLFLEYKGLPVRMLVAGWEEVG